MTYSFTPSVSQAYRDAIVAGVEIASRYIREEFNDTMCGTTVGVWSYSAGDAPPLGISSLGFSCCQPLLYLRSMPAPAQRSFWFDVSRPQLSRLEDVASVVTVSYFQLWSDWLGCFFGQPAAQVVRNAPVWYQVGFSSYLEADARHRAGLGEHPADYHLSVAKQGRTVLPLRDMVAEHPLDAERSPYKFSISHVAFEQLVVRAGLPNTIQFCRNVGQGVAWQTAFASTFGIPVETFYADFDGYLARP